MTAATRDILLYGGCVLPNADKRMFIEACKSNDINGVMQMIRTCSEQSAVPSPFLVGMRVALEAGFEDLFDKVYDEIHNSDLRNAMIELRVAKFGIKAALDYVGVHESAHALSPDRSLCKKLLCYAISRGRVDEIETITEEMAHSNVNFHSLDKQNAFVDLIGCITDDEQSVACLDLILLNRFLTAFVVAIISPEIVHRILHFTHSPSISLALIMVLKAHTTIDPPSAMSMFLRSYKKDFSIVSLLEIDWDRFSLKTRQMAKRGVLEHVLAWMDHIQRLSADDIHAIESMFADYNFDPDHYVTQKHPKHYNCLDAIVQERASLNRALCRFLGDRALEVCMALRELDLPIYTMLDIFQRVWPTLQINFFTGLVKYINLSRTVKV